MQQTGLWTLTHSNLTTYYDLLDVHLSYLCKQLEADDDNRQCVWTPSHLAVSGKPCQGSTQHPFLPLQAQLDELYRGTMWNPVRFIPSLQDTGIQGFLQGVQDHENAGPCNLLDLSVLPLIAMASKLRVMASKLKAMASSLEAMMIFNLIAMASNLRAMASNILQPSSNGLQPRSDGLQPSINVIS